MISDADLDAYDNIERFERIDFEENVWPEIMRDREREDEERRDRHDDQVDPWGYPEPHDEEPPRDYE